MCCKRSIGDHRKDQYAQPGDYAPNLSAKVCPMTSWGVSSMVPSASFRMTTSPFSRAKSSIVPAAWVISDGER